MELMWLQLEPLVWLMQRNFSVQEQVDGGLPSPPAPLSARARPPVAQRLRSP